MANAPTPSPFVAIIVAAGKGLRAGQPVPKQFVQWRGKPVLRHSAEALAASGARPIVVAIPDGAQDIARVTLEGVPEVVLITGGDTRQQSVARALSELSANPPDRVLIHDAARPILPSDVIQRLLDALDRDVGAIPVLPVPDSLALAKDGRMAGMADREGLRRVQTPQAFRYDAIAKAHRDWAGAQDAGDDAQVLRAAGHEVALVDGDERLKKLTYTDDFMTKGPPFRSGMGFDVHRLVAGEELWLGGIMIPHDKGLSGHSDADVALHALVDALLGAVGAGDIGEHFPPSDPQWRGASSDRFLHHAAKLVTEAGYAIANVDLTIMCEAPKIGPHRTAMRERIAALLQVEPGQVGVKATTTERLGFTGRGEGIAAQAIATVYRQEYG